MPRRDFARAGQQGVHDHQIADFVATLRDGEVPFTQIRKRVSEEFGFAVSEGTVSRAYDHARPEAVTKAAEEGVRPTRGSFSRLTPHRRERLRELLHAGAEVVDICRAVGCGASTVRRERQKLADINAA